MSRIYVIHENSQWTAPLQVEFERLGLLYTEWFLHRGRIDLSEPPPEGVFYNRRSASSHTRDHRYAAEHTAAVVAWLEGHGRRVLNTGRALQLEISKTAQYASLHAHGIRTPHTVATVGRDDLIAAARAFVGPFITKPNRGGKGLGVHLFRNAEALRRYVEGADFEDPIDGITLLQEYIEPPEPFITRCEFVGGEFLYAVRVDTSDGFELCPADDCQPGDAFCPATPTAKPRFEIVEGFAHPLIEPLGRFLDSNGFHIAGVEFVVDKNGQAFVYDVNMNTNYNSDAEARAGVSGMAAIARYLGNELSRTSRPVAQVASAALAHVASSTPF